MRKFTLTLLTALLCSFVFAQQNYWSLNSNRSGITTDKAVARPSFPTEFKLFNLNAAPLRQQLFSITGRQAASHSTVISLPNVDGAIEQFEVVEASNFEPALQERFPEIRAFSGRSLTDKSAMLKLSISPQGVQTMVFRADKDNEFIEAYSQDHTIYAVFKSHRTPGLLPWSCSTPEAQLATSLNSNVSVLRPESSAGQLKVMRLAQSVTAEYSNFFGATSAAQVGLVLAAINATMTRCNGCYEKDLAVHLNLIANTTDIIFYNAASDPYSNAGPGANGAWNDELQNTLTAIIGEANYDIGHLFGAAGGGGNAGCIGCVCDPGKGSGFTSPADAIPMGDNFDIDYVVHEVGHQLGGNHTYSHVNEGTGVNKEVGSGITIMGYAGITSQDVAPHSIDIYHEATIAQIQSNLATKTCPVTTVITPVNATPVVAAVSNYTIPITTPFALTGSATDANPGDVLTYCWEQNDNSTTTGPNSVARPTKTTGPNWLSFVPTTSPTRLFPKLATILGGLSVTPPIAGGDVGANIEALSSVARTLNFRLTVRDNCPYSSTPPLKVGQTSFTDMTVTVDASTGPFLITSQNAAVSYDGGTTQTVTWSVNGTTGAPINCANVKISFSTDGGLTFPTILAASTPNDGSETFTVPSPLTTTGRIKVEAIGNIFFDINNANITVTSSVPSFDFGTVAPVTVACAGSTTATATLNVTSILGYNTPVTLSATAGVPAGTNITFGTNPVAPGGSSTVVLNNTNTLAAGDYTVTITGVSGAITKTVQITFTVQPGAGPTINTPPASQASCVGTNVTFTVASPAGLSYLWQQSTDGGTNYTAAPGANTTATYTLNSITVAQNNYRYRVLVTGQCGVTTSSAGILTVQTAPAITAHPQNTTLCLGSDAGFSVTANGTGIGYLWQVSTDGGTNYNAAPGTNNAATYTAAGITTVMNNNRYRVVVSGTCTPPATSNAGILTVISPVVITTQPRDTAICETGNVTFTVAGTSTVPIIYEWQVSTNGGTSYTTIANDVVYSGATTLTLTISNVTPAITNNRYRARLSNATCTTPVASTGALFVVNPRPTVALTANPFTNLLPGQSTTISAAINPSPAGFNITWYKNTTLIPGITGTSYLVDSVEIGDYQVKILNTVTGCNNQSNVLTIGTTASERLFIFPSPNDGQFTVSYFNSSSASTQRTIAIYDSHGAQVYVGVMPVSGPYTLLNINLRGSAKGVYIIAIGDANGKKLTKGKFVIN